MLLDTHALLSNARNLPFGLPLQGEEIRSCFPRALPSATMEQPFGLKRPEFSRIALALTSQAFLKGPWVFGFPNRGNMKEPSVVEPGVPLRFRVRQEPHPTWERSYPLLGTFSRGEWYKIQILPIIMKGGWRRGKGVGGR
jgi:hypothetical protein